MLLDPPFAPFLRISEMQPTSPQAHKHIRRQHDSLHVERSPRSSFCEENGCRHNRLQYAVCVFIGVTFYAAGVLKLLDQHLAFKVEHSWLHLVAIVLDISLGASLIASPNVRFFRIAGCVVCIAYIMFHLFSPWKTCDCFGTLGRLLNSGVIVVNLVGFATLLGFFSIRSCCTYVFTA